MHEVQAIIDKKEKMTRLGNSRYTEMKTDFINKAPGVYIVSILIFLFRNVTLPACPMCQFWLPLIWTPVFESNWQSNRFPAWSHSRYEYLFVAIRQLLPLKIFRKWGLNYQNIEYFQGPGFNENNEAAV